VSGDPDPDPGAGRERRVPLDDAHRALGAALVAFAGWSMPVRYASDLAEHHAVRSAAGLFDVSHMGRIELSGPDAAAVLDATLVSRMHDLGVGRARYTMLCDASGGVVDDLIVTRLADRHLVVANAANTPAVLEVLRGAAAGRDAVLEHRTAHVLLALQGPAAAAVLAAATVADREQGAPDGTQLRPFRAVSTTIGGAPVVVSRTGYTGEDGFEIACADATSGRPVWDALLAVGAGHGVVPCGLAARDTLRLEAGLPLHGHELGPELGPFEAGFGRVVHLDEGRRFPGRAALERVARDGPTRRVVGLVAEGRRAPRAGYAVTDGSRTVGVVTSGAPSPTLGRPIALAAVEHAQAEVGTPLTVDVRGSAVPARVVALPFVLPAARRTT
jgi:aminomethyltransferase